MIWIPAAIMGVSDYKGASAVSGCCTHIHSSTFSSSSSNSKHIRSEALTITAAAAAATATASKFTVLHTNPQQHSQ